MLNAVVSGVVSAVVVSSDSPVGVTIASGSVFDDDGSWGWGKSGWFSIAVNASISDLPFREQVVWIGVSGLAFAVNALAKVSPWNIGEWRSVVG